MHRLFVTTTFEIDLACADRAVQHFCFLATTSATERIGTHLHDVELSACGVPLAIGVVVSVAFLAVPRVPLLAFSIALKFGSVIFEAVADTLGRDFKMMKCPVIVDGAQMLHRDFNLVE